ncbi:MULTISPECIES: ABC transporter permease [Arthrobacter]|uniref:ABC transporter permease n=1 Tax=Arthrobacter caoxuetaonis TaxID=2886935 RepID=A0A9X1SFT0_9MICC|nr:MULTISPECIES: ABC transporter permease [Arthrobacter]MCC3283445.1 ABC transporter permease [Arthrobacter caoxuetaonis]MCC3298844.1 ABC transporter permease [Arthrobacter caoxuetaonis]MCC9193452.1 ABC transporter permease [Arthrobacter sp. zg-Y916]USQ55806.1 ABC transporter permease [Arthrobacter caoxuetaonis]
MSAPASLPVRVFNQGKYEAETMLRNGEQLILAVVLPLLGLIALSVTPLLDAYGSSRVNTAVPGVLALCAMSTAFTGQGIATGFDRRYGVLRYLSTTPLGRAGLIAGKIIAVLSVLAIQAVLVTVVALFMGWQPSLPGIPLAVALLVLGAVAFTSLGLLVAGTVRPEATLAITNLLWILLAGIGGIIIPAASLPADLQPWIQALPSAALGDVLRSALLEAQFNLSATLILLAWTILGGLAAVRWFKWS